MKHEEIFSRFRGNPPVTAAEIVQFEASVGFKLPVDYAKFLKWANGGRGRVGPNAFVGLWRLEELVDKNRGYEVAEFAPGLFLFGSDGGGEAYAFDMRTPTMPIVEVSFIPMQLEDALFMAATFNDFLDLLSKPRAGFVQVGS